MKENDCFRNKVVVNYHLRNFYEQSTELLTLMFLSLFS